MRFRGWGLGSVALAASVLAIGGATAGPANAGEQPECDLFAAPDGSDSGAGTSADPLRSPQALVDELGSGTLGDPVVGCFEPGSYDAGPVTTIEGSYLRLESLGSPAELEGAVRVEPGASAVALDRLVLDGSTETGAGTLEVLGDDFSLTSSEVTERHAGSDPRLTTCIELGTRRDRADDAVITDNRIYDCGLPGLRGGNAVSVYNADGTRIVGNALTSNGSRAVQLYPSALHSAILGNDIRGNGSAVAFSAVADDGNPSTVEPPPTAENVVAGNLIRGNGRTRNAEGDVVDDFQVTGFAAAGGGNLVTGNCIDRPRGAGNVDATGFLAARNTTGEPSSPFCALEVGVDGVGAAGRCVNYTRGSAVADTVTGRRGGDMLAGEDGPDTLNGADGADCVYGGDDLDTLVGGAGSDYLHGGSNADVLRGGPGQDIIDARGDGSGDQVNCGAGNDLVLADAADQLARNCERVR
ncbi:hypothetical protein HJD18_05400 [Thermoleophilia bacterium SCSIO 60948]|nr:hypothetical protein HJD18_05400 [Thermoleophilia bacterium SCSIO 60948]